MPLPTIMCLFQAMLHPSVLPVHLHIPTVIAPINAPTVLTLSHISTLFILSNIHNVLMALTHSNASILPTIMFNSLL